MAKRTDTYKKEVIRESAAYQAMAETGRYDLADPSGTRTAEALALLGVLAERLCAWELTAYGGDPATEADWAHPLSVVQFDAPLRQRADSLGGDPTEAPAVDLRGPAGPRGLPGALDYPAIEDIAPGALVKLSGGVYRRLRISSASADFRVRFDLTGSSGAIAGMTNRAEIEFLNYSGRNMTLEFPTAGKTISCAKTESVLVSGLIVPTGAAVVDGVFLSPVE